MLEVALIISIVLGAVIGVTRAESKPSVCPSCGARTLIPDRHGWYWRCVPCEAQYFWVAGELRPYRGADLVPTATLRAGRDRDKVRE